MRQQNRSLGILQVMFAGFCFGFLGVIGKWAYSLGLRPGELLSLRFLTASGILGALLLWKNPTSFLIGRTAVLRSLALGIFGYALFSSCYFGALQGLSVSLTVLLLYTYPVWVTAGARIFFREKLAPRQLAALPIVLSGLVLLLWGELSVRESGALVLGLGSSIFYSAYILSSRKLLAGTNPFSASFYVMLGAGVTLAAFHLRAPPPSGEAWLAVLAIAVVGTIFPVSLFLAGLQKLKGAEASLLSLAEPCTAVLLGFVFFQETLSALQGAGALLIVLGMLLVVSSERT